NMDDLNRIIADLVSIRSTARVRVASNDKFVTEGAEKTKTISSEISAEKDRWKLRSETLSASISLSSEQVGLSDEAINNIESQHKRYIDNDVPSYKSVFQQITERESAQERQEEAHKRANSQASEVVELTNAARAKIEEDSAAHSESLAKLESELASTFALESDSATKAMANTLAEFDKATEEWVTEQQSDVEVARNVLATATAELKVVGASSDLLKKQENAFAAIRQKQTDKDDVDGKVKAQDELVTAT
ncbi:MAG: ATP-binding protein, partial [Opitutaceae bacterium]|nr:ATP-binding protein [Opitutaceae bacterium]